MINESIKYLRWKVKLDKKFENKPKLRQWLWFVGLWLVGLFGVLVLSYGTKAFFALALRL